MDAFSNLTDKITEAAETIADLMAEFAGDPLGLELAGSYTSGPKGFTVPEHMWDDRDGADDKFAWAVMHKPGANPVNGGRSRQVRQRIGLILREYNDRYLVPIGRHTPPGLMALPS